MISQLFFLRQSIENNRIPQAMIFSGPAGSAKKQIALEFVKLLDSQGDLILIEPVDREIQIEQIRDLQKALILKPRLSNYKIAIINEAEKLNVESQNCLLKTLEEPNASSLLILITSKPNALLATIRSRCYILKFHQTSFSARGEENFQKIEEILGLNLGERLSLCQKLFNKDESQLNLNYFLESFENFLRALLLKKLGLKNKVLDDFNPKTGRDLTIDKIRQDLETVDYFRSLISSTNANPKLAFENLLLAL